MRDLQSPWNQGVYNLIRTRYGTFPPPPPPQKTADVKNGPNLTEQGKTSLYNIPCEQTKQCSKKMKTQFRQRAFNTINILRRHEQPIPRLYKNNIK